MGDVVTLGPFLVQTLWLKWAISIIAAVNLMSFYAKRRGIWDGRFMDILFNAFLIIIVIWKISPVFSSFQSFISNPLSLLVLPGTAVGMWVGLVAASIYLCVAIRKNRMNGRLFFDLLMLGLVLSVMLFNLMGWRYGNSTAWWWGITASDEAIRYHPVNLYVVIALIPILYKYLYARNGKVGNGTSGSESLLYFGAGMFAVSLFDANFNFILGLTKSQWFYLGAVIAGGVLAMVLQRKHITVQQEMSEN